MSDHWVIGPDVPDEAIPDIQVLGLSKNKKVYALVPLEHYKQCPKTYCALSVLIILLFLKGIHGRSDALVISTHARARWGIDRKNIYKGLAALEDAHMIQVTRHTTKSPVVTILEPQAVPQSLPFAITSDAREYLPRNCVVCGTVFIPKRQDAKYCQDKCRQAGYRHRHWNQEQQKLMVESACPQDIPILETPAAPVPVPATIAPAVLAQEPGPVPECTPTAIPAAPEVPAPAVVVPENWRETPRICQHTNCGKEFLPKDKRQMYCCTNHKIDAWKMRARQAKKALLVEVTRPEFDVASMQARYI